MVKAPFLKHFLNEDLVILQSLKILVLSVKFSILMKLSSIDQSCLREIILHRQILDDDELRLLQVLLHNEHLTSPMNS
jgi:hypothetical protein